MRARLPPIARVHQSAIDFLLKLLHCVWRFGQKLRDSLADLATRRIANSFGTFDDCLTRELEDCVKQHRQDRYQSQQTQSKNLTQGRLHDIALVGADEQRRRTNNFQRDYALPEEGGETLRFISQSMENFPGPKKKIRTTANKKRNSSAVKNLSGSPKIIFTASRSAVRYATESKIVRGREMRREQTPS